MLSLLVLSGCSPYVEDFDYVPHPALAEIPPNPPDKAPPVSAFATVIGIRRADRGMDIPDSVEIRFRVENNGPHTITFDPDSLSLSTGDLLDFDPPTVQPEHAVTLAPSDIAAFDAFFPFPPRHSYDNIDMRSLDLRWSEKIDGNSVGQSVSFRRIYPYHYYHYYYGDPYWGPYWGPPWFYGGVVIVGHRR
jgi:hypothetical protein